MSRLCFILFLLLTIPDYAISQNCQVNRYREFVFDSVEVLHDVIYGNAPELTSVYINESLTTDIDLTMNLYFPKGDTLSERPCVILAFGGGFLLGSKEDEDIATVCDSLARSGFVAVSINYRLGMDILSASSGERAVHRATQDWSAAIRYVKEFANIFSIDTNWIFSGGVSAGAISAMNLAYGSEADRPISTFGWGGIDPAPDLGCINCSGNSYIHSTKTKALINCWGAIGDTIWIEVADSTPIISFHGDQDLVVPYNYGLPFTALATLPPVYGSYSINKRCSTLGVNSEFHSFLGEGHNVWGSVVNNSFVGGPTIHYNFIFNKIRDFLDQSIKPDNITIYCDSVACGNDTLNVQINVGFNDQVCWILDGINIISSNSNGSEIEITMDSIGELQIKAVVLNRFMAASDTIIQTIEVKPFPIVSGSTSGPTCLGDTIFLSGVTGGVPSWIPEALVGMEHVLQTYTIANNSDHITLRSDSNGCAAFDVIPLEILPLPGVPAINQWGDYLFIAPAYSGYSWLDLEGNTLLNGNEQFYPESGGLFSVLVTDSNGCQMESEMFQFIVSGSEEGPAKVECSLDVLFKESHIRNSEWEICGMWDVTGKSLWHKEEYFLNTQNKFVFVQLKNSTGSYCFVKYFSVE